MNATKIIFWLYLLVPLLVLAGIIYVGCSRR